MTADGRAAKAAHEIEKLIRIHFRNSYRDSLRPAQWQALRYFASAGRGDRSLTAFARHRRSTMGTASMTVSQLVERGYMERGDPDGQRNVGLRLTDKGWAVLENDPIHELIAAIGELGTHQIDTLCDSLERIAERLDSGQVEQGNEA